MAKTTAERIEQGKVWLIKHNRDGANYIWWKAGLTPGQKMGKHVTEAVQANYVKWHKAFGMWLRLYSQLETESGDETRDWADELRRDVEADYPRSAWDA